MLKKDITFIYMDSAEKSIYEPIALEAQRRGYTVKMTENKFEKCEIGFYCQHVNFPQYSKFSVIMLHDIIQQYGNWPDIWMREPWNKYDVGILPSKQWVKNWQESSGKYYTMPRKGIYEVGWPKADFVANVNREEYKKNFYEKYNLDLSKKTVLYAPAWENDHKQDDFVQSMLKLDVNILIKQYNATPEVMPEQYKNIQEMYELHKDNKRVTLLDTRMNIFDAIMASDVLVSEESSTMCEAVMMGIPAVSVSNWLIPDVTPSRYPECNYDFVIMTKKECLADCVAEIINDYENYQKETIAFRDNTFSNIGKVASIIMDIIDDCVSGTVIRYKSLKPTERRVLSIKENLKHVGLRIYKEVCYNYRVRYKLVERMWNVARRIKHALIKK